jgi:hypothetical protein
MVWSSQMPRLRPRRWSPRRLARYPKAFRIEYRKADANGVGFYDATSPNIGGTHALRVLAPTDMPTAEVPHHFLWVLPVEAGLPRIYGDGLETLRSLDVHNAYNLTILEPSFGIEPWYADNPDDVGARHETFLTTELLPWATENLARTGNEQSWLIGFSKSGLGAITLILKHPDLFTLAAAWDFPANLSSHDGFGASSARSYGTNANFLASYRLTRAFLEAHRAPFLLQNRLWIGGYDVFGADMSDFGALLTSTEIRHMTGTWQQMPHRWDGGWMPEALAALGEASAALGADG